jgi:hypothetical protein
MREKLHVPTRNRTGDSDATSRCTKPLYYENVAIRITKEFATSFDRLRRTNTLPTQGGRCLNSYLTSPLNISEEIMLKADRILTRQQSNQSRRAEEGKKKYSHLDSNQDCWIQSPLYCLYTTGAVIYSCSELNRGCRLSVRCTTTILQELCIQLPTDAGIVVRNKLE